MKSWNTGPVVSMRQIHAFEVVLPTRSDATTVKTCVPSTGAGTVALNGDVHGTAGAESSWHVNVTANAGSSGSVAEKLKTAELALVSFGGATLKANVGAVSST